MTDAEADEIIAKMNARGVSKDEAMAALEVLQAHPGMRNDALAERLGWTLARATEVCIALSDMRLIDLSHRRIIA